MKMNAGNVFTRAALASTAAAALVLCALPAQARITRIIIDRRATLAGQANPYETLAGRAFGELDPADPHNAIITDINPGKDADGKVRAMEIGDGATFTAMVGSQ